MTRAIITTGFAGLLALGSLFVADVFVSDAAAANGRSGQSANSFRHHHRAHRVYRYPYYYYGGYGYDYDVEYAPPPAPVVKPTAAKPEPEPRRGCEPQTYSVPASGGGESQVTVLRC